MAEEHKRSHFKLIVAGLLLAGILGLLFYSATGKTFPQNFTLGMFTNTQKTNTEPFGISLSTGTTALYGKSFNIDNSSISASGVCSSIKISGTTIKSSDNRCSISSDSFSGTFQYTQYGSVVFTGTADSLALNTLEFFNNDTANPVKFEIEVIPATLSANGISSKDLALVALSGSIQKFGKDGSLKAVSYLSQTSLDISNLLGRVELTTGELKVTGTATSVKGDEFNW